MSLGLREVGRLLRGRKPSPDELEAVRRRRLRALVRHAYDRVPYYRKLFDSAGLGPEDIRSAEDLRQVPVSTREAIRAAGDDVLTRGLDPTCGRFFSTSGSSGQPLKVFRTRREGLLHRASELRSMRWAGLRARDITAVLGPHQRMPRSLAARFGVYRTVQVLPQLPIEEQVRELRRIQPSVLWTYPTVLRALLHEIGSLEAIIRPRLLIHGAEPIDDLLRRQACLGLEIETRNVYGSIESGRIAWECPAGEGLHINTDCVILELEDDDGVSDAGRSVVITNLNAHAMPFLRYRLGDRCELIERPCSCGHSFPLMKPPQGRLWDVIALPSGRLLSPFRLNLYLRADRRIRQFRVVQQSIDRLILQLSFDDQPGQEELAILRERFHEQLGEPMTVEIEVHETLEDEKLKFRAFVSRISPPG